MKFFYFVILLLLVNCGSKQVFICGDRECVNKAEAQKYFEENFIVEVKINEKKIDAPFDLVKLNTKENIIYTEKTKRKINKLTKKERKIIKNKLKKEKKLTKKIDFNNNVKIDKITNKIIVKDICLSLENCDIDNIAKKLLEISKNKDYPNITVK
jgi:hypothetical protein|tara:strand:+ start:254 stop:718 length:465 start_codon:yes stop_codon:yes gene_type:complete